MAPDLNSTLFSTKACVSKNELFLRMICTETINNSIFFLAYGEAGNGVYELQANSSEVFEVLSLLSGSANLT